MSGKVVGWAMEQRTGSPVTKLVLVKLADNANEDGYCWPSVPLIVEHTELGERTVRDHLRKLEADGLISIEARITAKGQTSNAYQLNVPRSSARQCASPPAGAAPGGMRQPQPPPAGAAPGGVREAQGQNKNRQVEPSLNLPLRDAPPVTGRIAQLVDAIGRSQFDAWFGDVQILEVKPVRILAVSEFRARWIETKFIKILHRVFGDDVVLGTYESCDSAASHPEPQKATAETTDEPYWVKS